MAIYATTDFHGRLDLYYKMKEVLRPEDVVFFLGDAGDRGPDGWELIKTLCADEQFLFIKGNHEDMLVDAARAYLKNPECKSEAYYLLKRNGGEKTLEDWWREGAHEGWINLLDSLPLTAEYENRNGIIVLMSHAGYTPWTNPNNPNEILLPSEFELLWNRDHFFDQEYEEWLENSVVVHGHTSIPSLAKKLSDPRTYLKPGAYWYDDNRKCCIDNLSASSNVACLLDLDTFDEIVVEAY